MLNNNTVKKGPPVYTGGSFCVAHDGIYQRSSTTAKPEDESGQ
jgi:hypothetical protein